MKDEVWYQCQRCGNCCRWPGHVKLTEEDILSMARHFKITEWEFVQKYTRLRPSRDGLSLLDKENGECVFLDGTDCTVQAAKPSQCQGFPNKWNFPGWQDVCEAIPVERKPS
ncbi:MAG: YkgJ family cysteine cluster protein [Chthoniobacterales bacterium]